MPHIYAHRSAVPKTMRALAKIDPVPGLKLIEALVPTPGAGEVLVRVKKAALGPVVSRIDRWDTWARRRVRPPVIVGQEFVGLVAATGPGVVDFHPGELVLGEPCVACGTCRHCLAGRPRLCPASRRLGEERDGAFADYLCLPQNSVRHADPRLPLDVLACFPSLVQAVHAARRLDLFGANLLIFGSDSLAAMVAAVAKRGGARTIVVADSHVAGLKRAQAVGATHLVNPAETPLANLRRELALPDGFDCAVDTSGRAAVCNEMLPELRPGAAVALLGDAGEEAGIDLFEMRHRGITLHGLDTSGEPGDWERLNAALHGGLDITPVLGPSVPVGGFRGALDRIASGEAGTIVIDWDT